MIIPGQNTDAVTAIEPVSYTHLDVYKRQPENAGIGKLIMVTKIARDFHESMSETNEDRLSFKACYVQSTYVEASGDIIVFGPGCYQSHLYAGRAVHVQGRPGVVRGGVVYSRKEVIVNEAGSLAGTPTLFRVDAKGIIKRI